MEELTFNSLKLVKEFCNKNKRFYPKIENDKIIVKNKGGRNCTFKFSNQIKIKPSTIGLIDGEGYVKNTFIFANSDELIIKNILEFFLQFDIKPKTYLEICTKNTDDNFIRKSENIWNKIIKVNKIRLRNEFENTTDKGTLHIIYTNKIFCGVLSEILEEAKATIKDKKELAIDYLKGIIAAEGNINIKKQTKCVYMVRISAKEESVRKFYKELLEKIGINITCKDMETISKEECKKLGWKTDKGRAGCVIISRWDNFLKIFMLNLL